MCKCLQYGFYAIFVNRWTFRLTILFLQPERKVRCQFSKFFLITSAWHFPFMFKQDQRQSWRYELTMFVCLAQINVQRILSVEMVSKGTHQIIVSWFSLISYIFFKSQNSSEAQDWMSAGYEAVSLSLTTGDADVQKNLF